MESNYIQTIITTWNTKLYHERIACQCLYHHLPWHKHLRHGWKSLFVVVTDRMLEQKWSGSQKISLYSQFRHINNLKTLAKSECRQHETKCPSQLSLGTIGAGRSFMRRALDECEIIVTATCSVFPSSSPWWASRGFLKTVWEPPEWCRMPSIITECKSKPQRAGHGTFRAAKLLYKG